MAEQIALQWSAEDRDKAVWVELLSILQEVVARASLKEVAYRLGTSDKALAHALAERDRHYVRAEWLPGLVELAAEHGLAEKLCTALVAPAKLLVVRSIPLTLEQRCARLEKIVDSLGDYGARRKADEGL